MAKAKPTARQLEWADKEIGVLIHYLMNIYNPDFDDYKTDKVRTELSPDRFNPDKLDPEQWVKCAAELGAKYAVLVVNHCTGFSLWQTQVNDYSCASMAWKNGRGDILREFVDACKKYNIAPGVYYSTGCNGYYNINDEWELDYKSKSYQSYVKCVERQLAEIWGNYGEMFELWFDGGIVPHEKGGPDVQALINKYQPDAIAFQGPAGYPHNIRWVGNESGFAPEDCFAAVNPENPVTDAGDPLGSVWMPAETDFPNRSERAFGGGWGWKEGEEHLVYSPEHLLECYVNSVGRNTNMLVGMAIATDGSFQDEQQFRDFGTLFRATFGTPLAEIKNIEGNTLTITAEGEKAPRYLAICEDITDGFNVTGFSVFADDKLILEGSSIGHKRIIPLEGINASAFTVKITASFDTPHFKSVTLY